MFSVLVLAFTVSHRTIELENVDAIFVTIRLTFSSDMYFNVTAFSRTCYVLHGR